jgi:hypothetical protein
MSPITVPLFSLKLIEAAILEALNEFQPMLLISNACTVVNLVLSKGVM